MHLALALFILVQPAMAVGAGAAMVAGELAATVNLDQSMAEDGMAGCHGDTAAAPDCCADMGSLICGMDCGTATSAPVGTPFFSCQAGHGVFQAQRPAAAPDAPPTFFYKPPRTS